MTDTPSPQQRRTTSSTTWFGAVEKATSTCSTPWVRTTSSRSSFAPSTGRPEASSMKCSDSSASGSLSRKPIGRRPRPGSSSSCWAARSPTRPAPTISVAPLVRLRLRRTTCRRRPARAAPVSVEESSHSPDRGVADALAAEGQLDRAGRDHGHAGRDGQHLAQVGERLGPRLRQVEAGGGEAGDDRHADGHEGAGAQARGRPGGDDERGGGERGHVERQAGEREGTVGRAARRKRARQRAQRP